MRNRKADLSALNNVSVKYSPTASHSNSHESAGLMSLSSTESKKDEVQRGGLLQRFFLRRPV
ncbi:MAG: hypothetical protein AAFX93_13280 [Verrucomicrobiota bacterium]